MIDWILVRLTITFYFCNVNFLVTLLTWLFVSLNTKRSNTDFSLCGFRLHTCQYNTTCQSSRKQGSFTIIILNMHEIFALDYKQIHQSINLTITCLQSNNSIHLNSMSGFSGVWFSSFIKLFVRFYRCIYIQSKEKNIPQLMVYV